MKHHTKTKGDIGLTQVVADLTSHGIDVSLPISEHLPYDCIGIFDGEIRRIQVKYVAAKNGVMQIRLKNVWSNSSGTHKNVHDKSDYDLVAVYCPTTDQCYYFAFIDVNNDLHLRIEPTKNNQKKLVKLAENYVDPTRFFIP